MINFNLYSQKVLTCKSIITIIIIYIINVKIILYHFRGIFKILNTDLKYYGFVSSVNYLDLKIEFVSYVCILRPILKNGQWPKN